MSQWTNLKERAAGKWQIPLFVLSLLMLGGSLLRFRPDVEHFPWDRAVEHLRTLVSSDLHGDALEYGELLLRRKGRTEADRAPVHLALARAFFAEAAGRRVPSEEVGRQVVERYQRASRYPQSLTATDYLWIGKAYEWQRRFEHAVANFEDAIALGIDEEFELRRHIISVKMDELEASPPSSAAMLDRFLKVIGPERPAMRIWAVERILDVYEEQGRLAEVTTLLNRNRGFFEANQYHRRFQYLEALLLYKTGHFDEAEVYLRTIRNGVEREDEVHATTGWLLGRVVLGDGGPKRPLEALSFFSDVIRYHGDSPYAVASRIGTAEALVMLERHDEALESFRVVVDEIKTLEHRRVVNRDVLRASLGVMANAQRLAGRLAMAVEYAELAAELVDPDQLEQTALLLQQLAQVQFQLAAELAQQPAEFDTPSERLLEAASQAARDMFARAGETYVSLAHLAALNERQATDASWRAAEVFARAGARERATALYEAFVGERPQHSLVPRALLRIGQLRSARGDLAGAVRAYQDCYQRFPRTLDGARALVPLARSYLAMGPDYEELAEKTLLIVLDGAEVFTPEAPEFADALFLLGEAQNRRGDFERGIATLEEAMERYPDDRRVWKARFLLADGFRKSGLALKAEAADVNSAGEVAHMRLAASERFHSARDLYRLLISEYELRDSSQLGRLQQVYLRLAYFYEADCYFETRNYARALKLYEEAAGAHKDSTGALAAYVQIINTQVFLGEPEEARAALARALVLTDAIPDEAFARSVSPETRKDWKRYFGWLAEAELN